MSNESENQEYEVYGVKVQTIESLTISCTVNFNLQEEVNYDPYDTADTDNPCENRAVLNLFCRSNCLRILTLNIFQNLGVCYEGIFSLRMRNRIENSCKSDNRNNHNQVPNREDCLWGSDQLCDSTTCVLYSVVNEFAVLVSCNIQTKEIYQFSILCCELFNLARCVHVERNGT